MTSQGRHRLLRLFREARRRKVYTSAVAYVAVALVLLEVGDAVFQTLGIPAGFSILTILLILGFPLVIVLAWIFDIGAHGLERTVEPGSGSASGKPAATVPAPTPAPAPVVVRHMAAPPPAERGRPPAPAEPPDDSAAEAPDPERVRRAALAHVRHELKTPIGAIIGYSEMLLEDAADAPHAADLRSIRQAGHELLDLVEEILDTDRTGDAPGELASYSERIRAELRDPITAVIGYAEMLLEADDGVAAGAAPDLERIRAAAARLLEMSTDIVHVATGAHANGQLGAASALTETVLSKLRPIAAPVEERQGVLLIVDDNPLNRDLLSRQLARKGYEVAMAADGMAALQLLDEQTFDLVLLDILMPGIDGIEVLRRIRRQPRLAELPVIMTSSLDEIASVVRCLEIGAADYVTKPFDPTLLDARIGASLQLRAAKAREAYFRDQLAQRDAEQPVNAAIPRVVADRARRGGGAVVDAAEATVLWCDLDRLLSGEARSSAAVAAERMRRAVAVLQTAAAHHDIEIAMLQGGGMALAAGLPTPCMDAAERVAAAALDVLAAVRGDEALEPLRFGLHSGPLNGTLLDEQRFTYHLWGDALELAARLEQHAEAGTVHVSSAGCRALRDRFQLAARGVLEISGRQMRTHVLVARALQPFG